MRPISERLIDKVVPVPIAGCWLWDAHTNNKGYGMLGVGGRKGGMRTAHRVSWELHRGPIPRGIQVLHKCDVPSCVNPEHLYLGTAIDNMRDCSRKGRLSGVCTLKITHDQREKIRSDIRPCSVIANELGVSRQRIWQIRNEEWQ